MSSSAILCGSGISIYSDGVRSPSSSPMNDEVSLSFDVVRLGSGSSIV
jgi:hypothetical protein